MKSPWRASLFLLFAAAAISGGGVFHTLAERGEIPRNTNELYVGVWSSDPSVPVTAEIDVEEGATMPVAALYVNAKVGTKLLITASIDATPAFRMVKFSQSAGGGGLTAYYQVEDFSAQNHVTDANGGRGPIVATFALSPHDFIVGPNSVYVRMPTIANHQDQYLGHPYYGSDANGAVYGDVGLIDPRDVFSTDPRDYNSTDTADQLTATYWSPTSFHSKEVVEDLLDISTYTIEANSPANGLAASGGFFWTGSYGLAGTLAAVDPRVRDAQSNFEFISGLAFGVGATAVVALIQEFPDRRRKESETESASPLAPSGPVGGRPHEIAITLVALFAFLLGRRSRR